MAAKVFDGLFLGDAETSMDSDFLDLNKISRLVNLAGQQVQNVLSGHGFVYQTFCWEDQTDYLVFPGMEKDRALLDMVDFIDTSLRKGSSVLVFSLRGTSRSAFAICAFLMVKYAWGFEKAFDFILSKKSDLQINQGFVQQLFALEKRLANKRQKALRVNDQMSDPEGVAKERLRRKEWDPAYLSSGSARARSSRDKLSKSRNSDELSDNEEDELLLVNSYINSKNTLTQLPGPYRSVYDIQKFFKLRFNSVLQEEDVHVFPTSPPSRYDRPRGVKGILKKKHDPSAAGGEDDYLEVLTNGTKAGKPQPHFSSTLSDAPSNRPSSASKRTTSDDSSSSNRQPATATRPRVGSMDDSPPVQYRGAVQEENGRGQHQSSPSMNRPRNTPAATNDSDPYYSIAEQPINGSNPMRGEQPSNPMRGSQTAEDRLRHLMQDMRASNQVPPASKADDTSSRGAGSSSRGHKDTDRYGSGAKERDFNEYEGASEWDAERRKGGVIDRRSDDAAEAKESYPYKNHDSLSLYDLAALPLHLEDGRDSKYGDSDGYVSIYGSENREDDSRVRASAPSRNYSSSMNDRIALAHAEEQRERERDNAYIVQLESQQVRRKEREVDPLSAFQQQGHESAVRVRYTALPASNMSMTTPNRSVRNAWQEDGFRDRREGRESSEGSSGSGDRQGERSGDRGDRSGSDRPPLPSSSRQNSSSTLNHSVDSRNSDRMSVTSLQTREREREKALRTYRHGSPAPSRVSSSSRPVPSRGPPLPSSSGPPQRTRAASPSMGGTVRGSSPGPAMRADRGDNDRSQGVSNGRDRPPQLQRRGSIDSGNGSLGDFRSLAGSEISQDTNRGYTANGGRGPVASAPNRFQRPPSPGTRKGPTPTASGGANNYMSASQSNGRSSTPTRGGWRF